MEIVLQKQNGKWIPFTQHAKETSDKFKNNQPVLFRAKKLSRKQESLGLFFALLNCVFDQMNEACLRVYPTETQLRMAILINVGWHETVVDMVTGEARLIPKSLSYDKLPDERVFRTEVLGPSFRIFAWFLGIEEWQLKKEYKKYL